jgi:hypothetical protein
METNQLTLRWVPVTDTSGRTHMEAVWITETPAPAQLPAATQAA